MIEVVPQIEELIIKVFDILGKPINKEQYIIIDRGVPHRPQSLPTGMMGVYSFWHDGLALKIGKAGPSSNARFLSQHYNPKSAPSTLAASLLHDKNMTDKNITSENVNSWIKGNCHRIDILLNIELGVFALELVEAILHYKYEPIYEGFISQR